MKIIDTAWILPGVGKPLPGPCGAACNGLDRAGPFATIYCADKSCVRFSRWFRALGNAGQKSCGGLESRLDSLRDVEITRLNLAGLYVKSAKVGGSGDCQVFWQRGKPDLAN